MFQNINLLLFELNKNLKPLFCKKKGYYEEIKKCSTDEFVYHIFANIKDIYEFTKLVDKNRFLNLSTSI